jgi:hypothetical protein
MKKGQKNIAQILLWIFMGVSALPLILPDAPPQAPDNEVRFAQFEEGDDTGMEGLRTASENREENTRPNDFIFVSFIEDFHSACYKSQLAEAIELKNTQLLAECKYIWHSSFLI